MLSIRGKSGAIIQFFIKRGKLCRLLKVIKLLYSDFGMLTKSALLIRNSVQL